MQGFNRQGAACRVLRAEKVLEIRGWIGREENCFASAAEVEGGGDRDCCFSDSALAAEENDAAGA